MYIVNCRDDLVLRRPTYDSSIADYPHWQMTPELKRYYLMQASYWCQQLIVLVFRLEKPRKDYKELVAHHLVTLWLIGFVTVFRYTRTSLLTPPFPDGVMGLT